MSGRFLANNWLFLKGAVQHTVDHLLATLFVWLLIGLSVSIPSACWLMYDGVHGLQSHWIEDTGFNVFLNANLDESAIQTAAEEIESHALIDSISLTMPEDAIAEFLANSNLPVEMSSLEFDALPASLAVIVDPSMQEDEIQSLVELLQSMDAVAEVRYNATWTTRLSSIKHLLYRLGWFFVIVFGVSSLFVISAAVRLAIDSRLDEIKLMHLLGSPDGLMHGMFNYCGLLYGFGGGLSAAMILAIAVQLVEGPLNRLVSTYGQDAIVLGYDSTLVLALLLIGSIAGIAAAVFITWQRIRRLGREMGH